MKGKSLNQLPFAATAVSTLVWSPFSADRFLWIGIATMVGTVITSMTTGGIGDGTTITNSAITITVMIDLSARHGV
jgi:hypothetical protein